MKVEDLFVKNQDVVLYPENFREVLVSCAGKLLKNYKLGKIYFAETTDPDFIHFPVVLMELYSEQNEKELLGYFCYVLSTQEIRILPAMIHFHILNTGDVAQKVSIKLADGLREGKVAMVKKRLALRFRKEKKSTC